LGETHVVNNDAWPFYANLTNREQVLRVTTSTGAKVLVADFGDARVSDQDPVFRDWHQLGNTHFYALRLN
jgi:hypothetical protein